MLRCNLPLTPTALRFFTEALLDAVKVIDENGHSTSLALVMEIANHLKWDDLLMTAPQSIRKFTKLCHRLFLEENQGKSSYTMKGQWNNRLAAWMTLARK